jgi:hypothetical protein
LAIASGWSPVGLKSEMSWNADMGQFLRAGLYH